MINPTLQEVKDMVDGAIGTHEKKRHKVSGKLFKPPTVKEIDEYCIDKRIEVLPQYIWDFYEQKGWKVGKNKMSNWHSAVSRARYWADAPRRRLPKLANPKVEAEALERKRNEIRKEDGDYFREKTTKKLKEMRQWPKMFLRRWLIDEILDSRSDGRD